MRTTTVPAQITTVEDKIVGELSITQLLLLVAPVFGGAALFTVLPPFFSSTTYKIMLIVCITAVCATLAIRIKGRLVLMWLLVITRYVRRPRYYVFNKNDVHLRDIPQPEAKQSVVAEAKPKKKAKLALPHLSTADLVKVEGLMGNPDAGLHFVADKKGGLSVRITEV